MARYLGNAFSANMLPEDAVVRFQFISLESAQKWAEQEYESFVGHAETAQIVSLLLATDVPVNRTTIELYDGDELLIIQYSGSRLPEGATSIPADAGTVYVLVTVEDAGLAELRETHKQNQSIFALTDRLSKVTKDVNVFEAKENAGATFTHSLLLLSNATGRYNGRVAKAKESLLSLWKVK